MGSIRGKGLPTVIDVYILHTRVKPGMGGSWSSDDVLKALRNAGFERVGQKGSHVKLRRAGRTVIVPHPRKGLPRGTLASIARQAGIRFD